MALQKILNETIAPVVPRRMAAAMGLLVGLVLFPSLHKLAAQPLSTPHVEAELVPELDSIHPGQPFRVALRLRMEHGWHTYWRNPGDAGMPTSIEWDIPEGFTAGAIEWPYPELLGEAPEVSYGYGGEIFLPVEISPPADLKSGTIVTLTASAAWLVCNDICIPGEAKLALELPVGTTTPRPHPWFSAITARVPTPLSGWRAEAARLEGDYLLRLTPDDPSARLPLEATFFAGEESVIDHSAPQMVRSADGTLTIRLVRSSYASAPAERLRGVIHTAGGWNADGSIQAMEIDIPVESTAQH